MAEALSNWVLKIYMRLLQLQQASQYQSFTFQEAQYHLAGYYPNMKSGTLRKAFQEMIERDWMEKPKRHNMKQSQKIYKLYHLYEMQSKFNN